MTTPAGSTGTPAGTPTTAPLAAGPVPLLPRTGVGVDVHAFAPEGEERALWLGGLHWPGERGLAGHSDADVAAHAAADALFSATGLGDLGSNFGTSARPSGRARAAPACSRRRRDGCGPPGSRSGTWPSR